jgi:hypothetical protein
MENTKVPPAPLPDEFICPSCPHAPDCQIVGFDDYSNLYDESFAAIEAEAAEEIHLKIDRLASFMPERLNPMLREMLESLAFHALRIGYFQATRDCGELVMPYDPDCLGVEPFDHEQFLDILDRYPAIPMDERPGFWQVIQYLENRGEIVTEKEVVEAIEKMGYKALGSVDNAEPAESGQTTNVP